MEIKTILNFITFSMIIIDVCFYMRFKFINKDILYKQIKGKKSFKFFYMSFNFNKIIYIYIMIIFYIIIKFLIFKNWDKSFFENMYMINISLFLCVEYYKSFFVKISSEGIYSYRKFTEWKDVKSYTLEEEELRLILNNSKVIVIGVNSNKNSELKRILDEYL